jgi:hypothetical protein
VFVPLFSGRAFSDLLSIFLGPNWLSLRMLVQNCRFAEMWR